MHQELYQRGLDAVTDRLNSEVAKRCVDVTISCAALLVTAPLQGALAVSVRLAMGRPVFFRQTRPGRNGRLFTLWKFRTMRPPDPLRGTTDDVRLTLWGNVLRRTSLDELPTLWNVLKGDMSLIGPRPLLPEYLCRYSVEQARRHEVRPGVTGLAQVNGRNAISWERRLALDVEYVERRCATLDLQILLKTIKIVLTRSGISADGHSTMPSFGGAGASAKEASGTILAGPL